MPAKLLVCILTRERLHDGVLRSVTRLLPRVDFALKKLSAGDAPAQTLTTEDAHLDFRHIQPARMLARVVELHSAQELGRCALAQHVVEALSEVGVQIVQNQMHPVPVGEAGGSRRQLQAVRLGRTPPARQDGGDSRIDWRAITRSTVDCREGRPLREIKLNPMPWVRPQSVTPGMSMNKHDEETAQSTDVQNGRIAAIPRQSAASCELVITTLALELEYVTSLLFNAIENHIHDKRITDEERADCYYLQGYESAATLLNDLRRDWPNLDI